MKTGANIFSPMQKINFLILSSFLSITVDRSNILAGYLFICMVLFLTAGIPSGKLRLWLGAVLLTFWGTLLSQSLFYAQVPRTSIFRIVAETTPVIGTMTGGLHVYREGVEYGLIQGMRFVITLTCGLFVCFTTESKDLLRAAIRLKIPVNISFMVSIALHFVPLIIDETRTVLRAQKLRGFSPVSIGLLHPILTARLLLRPVLVNAVRRSAMLSLSVESRHFSHQKIRYSVRETSGSFLVSIMIGVGIMAIAAAAGIKFVYFLYISNLFYASWLRPLYAIAENRI